LEVTVQSETFLLFLTRAKKVKVIDNPTLRFDPIIYENKDLLEHTFSSPKASLLLPPLSSTRHLNSYTFAFSYRLGLLLPPSWSFVFVCLTLEQHFCFGFFIAAVMECETFLVLVLVSILSPYAYENSIYKLFVLESIQIAPNGDKFFSSLRNILFALLRALLEELKSCFLVFIRSFVFLSHPEEL
jgi:hypothetical protein